MKFALNAWSTNDASERAAMSRDLVRNHLFDGMSRGQVEKLLGKPDDTTAQHDAEGRPIPGTEEYAYYLGDWDVTGTLESYVRVRFDNSGHVVEAWIGH